MKTCSKCKQSKKELEFGKDKNGTSGIKCYCFECARKVNRAFFKTKHGLATRIYNSQVSSSKKRGQPCPTYSKEDLKDWLFAQPKFHILYDNWKRLNHQKNYIPSVDRKDDSISYTMANIQLMIWGENYLKSRNDIKNGKLKTKHIQVLQFSKKGEFINRYCSFREAASSNGMSAGGISLCCRGMRKTAGGFKWEFAKQLKRTDKGKR